MILTGQCETDVAVRQAGDRDAGEQRRDAGDAQVAVEAEAGGDADDALVELQAADAQAADVDAEVRDGAAAGPRGRLRPGMRIRRRSAQDADAVDRRQVDPRGEAEQPERPPVQHDPVQRRVAAQVILQGEAPDRQSVGKASAQAVDRDQAAAERAGLALDQTSTGTGIGAEQHREQRQADQRHRHAEQQPGQPGQRAPGARTTSPDRHQKVSPSPI